MGGQKSKALLNEKALVRLEGLEPQTLRSRRVLAKCVSMTGGRLLVRISWQVRQIALAARRDTLMVAAGSDAEPRR
jgi:hypothetical protein